MSSWQRMQAWREKRKAAYDQYQQFASLANSINAIKTSEAIGKGNIVAKVAYQRSVSKLA